MITWAAPKFSSQASQFIPVPPQKNHTHYFGSAVQASPFSHAAQLTDFEYTEFLTLMQIY